MRNLSHIKSPEFRWQAGRGSYQGVKDRASIGKNRRTCLTFGYAQPAAAHLGRTATPPLIVWPAGTSGLFALLAGAHAGWVTVCAGTHQEPDMS